MSSPETAVALQEAQVEPAREAQVHTQHQEKRNEAHYCSIVGHGTWAAWRQMWSLHGQGRCPGVATEQERWSRAGWRPFHKKDTEPPRGEYWGIKEPAKLRTGLDKVPNRLRKHS